MRQEKSQAQTQIKRMSMNMSKESTPDELTEKIAKQDLAAVPDKMKRIEELMAEAENEERKAALTERDHAKALDHPILTNATIPTFWTKIDHTTYVIQAGNSVIVKDATTGHMVHCPGVQIIAHPDGTVKLSCVM